MSIRALTVDGLFGSLNYNLVFDSQDIVIITGPNGYGKTMLLKIIDYILKNQFRNLVGIKFKTIHLSLDKGISITIDKIERDLNITFSDIYNDRVSTEYLSESNVSADDEEVFYLAESGEKIKLLMHSGKSKKIPLGIDSEIFKSYFSDLDTTFIKAQRLQEIDAKKIKISELADDLKKRMIDASVEASIITQRLDSSFPTRLFERIENTLLAGQSFQTSERLRGLQKVKNDFNRYGLIESDDNFTPNGFLSSEISKTYSEVLNLYVEDALKKIDPYTELYKKIDLFVNLLSESILSFKEINVDKKKGFYFTGLVDGEDIPLDSLSSGEQNQVIIYYDMIFNSKENTIILIDEPEISLHVAWQKGFLDSVKKIQYLNKPSKIVLATHSPTIINNRWDLSFDLFEISNNKGQ